MAESQNTEWKESWRDDYLKWICGFANAQGGKIYIGMNDSGHVVGIPDSKKLLEDIPNKVQTTMGIIVDVNLLTNDDKSYIEIIVSPSSYPVSYKGEYHYRTGSTKQQLRGSTLTEFLVSKTGLKWDAVPVDDFKLDDLDKESFDIFRKEAMRSGRMSKEDLDITNPYNPDIANTFFRAGYVETWGRGIQKICEACRRHGIPVPEYTVLGGDITVKFTALKSAKALKPHADALADALEKRMLDILKANPKIKQADLVSALGSSRATVQRIMKTFSDNGTIERIGGKRYGYWEIHE